MTTATTATIETTIEMMGKLLVLAQQKIEAASSDNAKFRSKALKDLATINEALVRQNLELWTKVAIAETKINMTALQATVDAVEQKAPIHCRDGLIKSTNLEAPHTPL